MNIKQAADRAGLNAKTIRYYEEIDLINPGRTQSGYRDFSNEDVAQLAFIARARSLGFSTESCRTLLSLYGNPSRASADVKAIAIKHLEEIEQKITELNALKTTLADLVHRCAGDGGPDCPIIDGLAAPQKKQEIH